MGRDTYSRQREAEIVEAYGLSWLYALRRMRKGWTRLEWQARRLSNPWYRWIRRKVSNLLIRERQAAGRKPRKRLRPKTWGEAIPVMWDRLLSREAARRARSVPWERWIRNKSNSISMRKALERGKKLGKKPIPEG